jgi:hypothetical protein
MKYNSEEIRRLLLRLRAKMLWYLGRTEQDILSCDRFPKVPEEHRKRMGIKARSNAANAEASMSNPHVIPFGFSLTAALRLPLRMNSSLSYPSVFERLLTGVRFSEYSVRRTWWRHQRHRPLEQMKA